MLIGLMYFTVFVDNERRVRRCAVDSNAESFAANMAMAPSPNNRRQFVGNGVDAQLLTTEETHRCQEQSSI
jgi:hypothetical protein